MISQVENTTSNYMPGTSFGDITTFLLNMLKCESRLIINMGY